MKNSKAIWEYAVCEFSKKLLVSMAILTAAELFLELILHISQYGVSSFKDAFFICLAVVYSQMVKGSNSYMFLSRLNVSERTVVKIRCAVYAAGFLIMYLYQKLLVLVILRVIYGEAGLMNQYMFIELSQEPVYHTFLPAGDWGQVIHNILVPVFMGVSLASVKTLKDHGSKGISETTAWLAALFFVSTSEYSYIFSLGTVCFLPLLALADLWKAIGLAHDGKRLNYVEK